MAKASPKPPKSTPTPAVVPPPPPVVANQPSESTYTEPNRSPLGSIPRAQSNSAPIDQGYAVKFPNADPAGRSNGMISDQFGRKIYFWVEEMEASVNMAGSTSQSRRTRQFFPHNMNQPSFVIRGRCPDSYRFNQLAEFVRESQYASVSGKELRAMGSSVSYNNSRVSDTAGNPTGDSIFDPTVKLTILGRPTNNTGNPFIDGSDSPNATKGKNHEWVMNGYIKNIQAGAKKFDPAPAFEFEFLVSQVKVGLWTDADTKPTETLNWMTTFASAPRNTFVPYSGSGSNPRPNPAPTPPAPPIPFQDGGSPTLPGGLPSG